MDSESLCAAVPVPAAHFACGLFVRWWGIRAALLYTAVVLLAYLCVAAFVPVSRHDLALGLGVAAAGAMGPWCVGRLWTAGQTKPASED